jgi:crossover junction endodeoxyribonuclease RuvC
MLKLGRAQGVVISAARYFGLLTTEYSPRKIKLSVAGNGNASKEQVARMIEKQFSVNLAKCRFRCHRRTFRCDMSFFF